MKIIYLVDTLYKAGGMEHILTAKANALTERYGHEVLLVTNHQKGRPVFFPLSSGVRHIDLDVNYRIPLRMRRYVKRLSALILAERPDIVVSTCGKELFRMHQLPRTGVVMAEFHFSHETYRIKGQLAKLRRMEKAVGGLDCFVSLTKEDAEAWKPFCPRVEQIYNPSFFASDGRFARPAARKRCLSAGRFEKQKNFEDLVRVWKQVHASHPGWTLDIFGNGRLKDRLAHFIDREGLGPSIHLHPSTHGLRKEMLESSLFLMTSIYEGFPLVMIEAASAGLPFISYACPCGPAEFIRDGVDGFTVPVGDVDGMATRISDCLDRPQLLEEMGRNIRSRALAFGADAIMDQWNRLFSGLLTGR
jgi:glycosyltransferase involved in cell wall biosynthesis